MAAAGSLRSSRWTHSQRKLDSGSDDCEACRFLLSNGPQRVCLDSRASQSTSQCTMSTKNGHQISPGLRRAWSPGSVTCTTQHCGKQQDQQGCWRGGLEWEAGEQGQEEVRGPWTTHPQQRNKGSFCLPPSLPPARSSLRICDSQPPPRRSTNRMELTFLSVVSFDAQLLFLPHLQPVALALTDAHTLASTCSLSVLNRTEHTCVHTEPAASSWTTLENRLHRVTYFQMGFWKIQLGPLTSIEQSVTDSFKQGVYSLEGNSADSTNILKKHQDTDPEF